MAARVRDLDYHEAHVRAAQLYPSDPSGRDHAVPWLSSMAPRSRLRYAHRLHAMEEELEEEGASEMRRSLAVAILRAEREGELASQTAERFKRRGDRRYREARDLAYLAAERHAYLLSLWFDASKAREPREGRARARTERRIRGRVASRLGAEGVGPPVERQRPAPDDASDLIR